MEARVFCNYKSGGEETVLFENEYCVCMTRPEPIPEGSCIIIPKAHRVTVFDLSYEEW